MNPGPNPLPVRPRTDPPFVKICGLSSVQNALDCAQAGADWIGLNFHPASPRFVDLAIAAEIVASLPARAQAVGLFVDRTVDDVRQVAERVGLWKVQLHGREPVEHLVELHPLEVVRAFRLADSASIDAMIAYLAEADRRGCPPYAVLLDAYVAGVPGGTGRAIPDRLLALLPTISKLILAGGLTPENVAERVKLVGPWMVDAAGGVESAPGMKDPEQVRRFATNARIGFETAIARA